MGLDEGRPGGVPLPLGGWLDAVLFEDITDGGVRDVVSQVGERALDPVEAQLGLSCAKRIARSRTSSQMVGRPILVRRLL
jgi:hypothetical protein